MKNKAKLVMSPTTLDVKCFGIPQILRDQAPLTPPLGGKALALLLYLAVTGQPQSRDKLADLFWREQSNQGARNNLRYVLPELRKAAGDHLLITPHIIAFDRSQPYTVDSERFRHTLTAALDTVPTAELQAVLALYHGDFLAGFRIRNAPIFEEWVTRQQEELRALAIGGLYHLAERYYKAANYTDGLAASQRLLNHEPWHEAGHRLQMQLLASSGQRSAALAQYDRCRTILAAELGIEPEATTTTLYEQMRCGKFPNQDLKRGADKKVLLADFTLSAPLLVAPALLHNLPGNLTPFFGREAEIQQASALLADAHYRLITLVGEGGSGKTRLALAVAQTILNSDLASPETPKAKNQKRRFPDGIWFVPLSGLTVTADLSDQLANAVAQAIGWQFNGSGALLTQLLTYLHDKALCLLFDNAEHLLPGLADFLISILQGSAQSTLLVTSQHSLNLQAEFVWHVNGLPIPPDDGLTPLTPDELSAYSSSALFIERASRLNRNFQLTAATRPAVAAICRQVEGLPLAIELAAALTKQYSCPDLYMALRRDYTVLAADFADLPPRHRSIHAMLDYSWQFLSPDEARTLAACAIFVGGFTLAAAALVANATPAVLTVLMDHSLLQRHGERFVMHNLVHQYAATQLAHSPDYQQAAKRHAAYYINLLHALEGALLVTVEAQQTVQNELDNVRAAWRWSSAQADLTLLDKGAESLHCFYYLTGLYREGIHLLEAAISALSQVVRTTAVQPQRLLAKLSCYIAHLYRRSGAWDNGERIARTALSLSQQLADPTLQGVANHELARLAYVRGNFSLMYELAEQGYAQARQSHLPQLIAECLNDLAIAVSMCNGPLAAISHFHAALEVLQTTANRVLEAFIYVNLGFFYLACQQYQDGHNYLQQGIALQRLLQMRGGIIMPLLYLGDLWTALGLYQAAQQQYAQVMVLVQAIHSPYSKSCLHTSYGRLQHLCGEPRAALSSYESARELAQQSGLAVQEEWALVYQGHALMELGEMAAARDSYQQAIMLHKTGNWIYRTADAHAGLAALLLATNEVAAAVTHSEAALAFLAQYGLAGAREPFLVYWTAARVFQAAGDPRAAAILHSACQQLQEIAGTITDETVRQSFLSHVEVNRRLIAMAPAAEHVERLISIV